MTWIKLKDFYYFWMKIKDQLHKNEHKTVDDYLKFNDMNEI